MSLRKDFIHKHRDTPPTYLSAWELDADMFRLMIETYNPNKKNALTNDEYKEIVSIYNKRLQECSALMHSKSIPENTLLALHEAKSIPTLAEVSASAHIDRETLIKQEYASTDEYKKQKQASIDIGKVLKTQPNSAIMYQAAAEVVKSFSDAATKHGKFCQWTRLCAYVIEKNRDLIGPNRDEKKVKAHNDQNRFFAQAATALANIEAMSEALDARDDNENLGYFDGLW